MISIIFLVIVSLLPLVSLFHPGIPATHDGQDHIARIANFYQSLVEGNVVPRWAENLNWGYGHPILMFLYPLPSYVASVFRSFGYTFVDSTKLVFGVTFIVSVVGMYIWLRRLVGTLPATVGALLYGFAPYRFVDLYVRGALGEHVAFAFVPLVFYGLSSKRFIITSLAIAALILSHNAVSIMFMPLILLYTVYLYWYETKKSRTFFIRAVGAVLLGISLSAFFWFPAYFEGKYTLRDIVTKGEFVNRFVPLQSLFYSPWNFGGGNEFSKELGIIHWVGVSGMLWFFGRIREQKQRLFLFCCLILLAGSLFLMNSSAAAIWHAVTFIQKFQFPWRLLSVSVFISAVLGAHAFAQIPKSRHMLGFIIVVAATLLLTRQMWRANGFIDKPDSYYAGTYNSTTDTGESSPIWSVRFMEKQYGAPLEVIDGVAEIREISRTSTRHEYTAAASKQLRVVENTLYFPGWNVFIDGTRPEVQFQDPAYRGLMTFEVAEGKHTVVVQLSDTKVRKLANYVSVVALGILGTVMIIPVWKKRT